MNRIFTLIFLFFFISFGTHAQYAKFSRLQHRQVLDNLLSRNPKSKGAPGARTMSSSALLLERIKAQSTFNTDSMAIIDSFYLGYVGKHTSTYDYNMLFYPYAYPYAKTPMFQYNGYFNKPQVLYDSLQHWTLDPFTLTYGYYDNALPTYDTTNNNLTNYQDLFADSALLTNMAYVNTFDAAHNITAGYLFTLSGGIEDSAYIQYFKYDASEHLIEDSTYQNVSGTWYIVSKTYYSYNASGDLIKISCYNNLTDTSFSEPLQLQVQYVNTYDASHNLQTVETDISDSTALIPYVFDTFSYAAGTNFYQGWVEWNLDTVHATVLPFSLVAKKLNSMSLPDTAFYFSWDSSAASWTPLTEKVIYYDSYNNPDSIEEFPFVGTGWGSTISSRTIYYYQVFLDSGVCTPTLSASVTNLSCYNSGNGAVTLTSTGGAGTITYQWRGPSGFTSSSPSIASLQAGNYVVVATGFGGCSDSVSATVTQPPAINVVTPTIYRACVGDTLHLSTTISGGTGTLSYAWVGPMGFTATVSSPYVFPVVSGDAGGYTLVVTDAAGCTDTSYNAATVGSLPIVKLGHDTSICVGGGGLTLDAGNPGDSYLWSTGAATEAITITTSGTYYVAVTSGGCTSRDTITVGLDSAISAAGIDITSLSSSTKGFSTLSPHFVDHYTWTFGDGATSTAATPTHAYTATGSYTVTLDVSNACGSKFFSKTITISTITPVSLTGVGAQEEITIYPNPATDIVHIQQANVARTGQLYTSIIDVNGQVVSISIVPITNGETQLSLAGLPASVYLLVIRDEQGSIVCKQQLVKQ
jgi:PKD repeat protein